ncbi:MAG TPA: nuclear transport factor 2 family protein [Rhizomicrobium sp.]
MMQEFALAATLLMAVTAANAAAVSTDKDVAAKIVAMERAALDRSDKGDVQRFLELSAPDVVYQDPALTKPIVGIEALTKYYKSFPSEASQTGEMVNSNVQVFGTIAVLSFHYIVRRDNTVIREWNCTEVYRQDGADWRIVNTHWSLTLPPGQKLG